ncbi:MAG: serine/threonine protein kinase, partial [Coleofasciculus sp. A1-SPW-01]
LTGVSPADLPQRNLRIQFREQVSINSQLISWIEVLTEPDLDLRLSCASQALDALDTGRSICYPLESVYPPFFTQIKLKKSPHKLVIKFPAKKLLFCVGVLVFGFKLTLCISLCLLFTVMSFFTVFSGVYTMVNFSTLIVGNLELLSWLIISIVVFSSSLIFASLIFGQNISKGYLEIKREIDSFILPNFCAYYVTFDKNSFLVCNKLNFHLLLSEIQQVNPDYLKQSIYLKTRKRNYCLAHYLKPSEVKWLVYEIQDWLADC